MLTKCPECELQISDKAFTCPHCGYPLQKPKYTKQRKKPKRLPNGFGQISLLKGNLRKPYRAMVTVGKNKNGRPICKLLKPEAYFKTYNDAYMALVEYNKNPYELDSELTVKQLYEKWTEQYFKTLKSKSSTRTITSAWLYCSKIYNLRARDLRAFHIKSCMEEGQYNGKYASATTKSRIKSMFNLMLDYALEYELIDKNYARTFKISQDVLDEKESSRKEHISFTPEEMATLWENMNDKWVSVVLLQCYMGWRPQELGLIELRNVDLVKNIIVAGMKTDAGTNRTVPILPELKNIVRVLYDEAEQLDSEYLINCTDSKDKFLTYDKYRRRFDKVIAKYNLNPKHRAHDPRKQFVTMLKNKGVDEYAIKRLIGHSIADITERIYTDRDIDWLETELTKLLKKE